MDKEGKTRSKFDRKSGEGNGNDEGPEAKREAASAGKLAVARK
jgi:hypothetical protein